LREGSQSKLAWWVLLLLICTHFCLAYVQNDHSFLNLDEYIRGQAKLPYQYRVLMVWVMRFGVRIPYLDRICAHLPAALRDPRITVLFAAAWISLAGSVLLTWRSLTLLTSNCEYSRWASLLVVYMAYFHFPLVFGPAYLLPYDLPSLLFFCGCVYAVISRRLIFFYLFFIPGVFNRETICMATAFLLIWEWQRSRAARAMPALAIHIFFQCMLWLGIRLYLRHLFPGNVPEVDSEHFYYKLGYNLHEIIKPQQWPVLLSVFGFTLPLVLAWRKRMKNAAMQGELYLVAAWFAIMMLTGVIVEIRIFAELISYMALAVGLIVYNTYFAANAVQP
jgi:hypothetical protein